MPRLLIAASGTGGHIFPAIAVAEALPKSWEISWLGVSDRLESELVPDKYRITKVRLAGLQTNKWKRVFQFFNVLISIWVVIRLIKSENIHLVFTTGGYIAAPAIIGAKLCGVKVILHESNAFPGKVTRLLGKFCNLVALGLPPAKEYLKKSRTVFTGTPVRKAFLVVQVLPDWVPVGAGPLIIVMGGSQGAIGLNQMVGNVIPTLLNEGCRIVHLTGNKAHREVDHKNFVARSFSKDIAALFQHADLVISRAGAGTLCELSLCGAPAILVPYPYAADRHQDFNASYAAECGAALIVSQHDPNKNILGDALKRLLKSRFDSVDDASDFLAKMSRNMKMIAIRDSEKKLVEIITHFH